MRKRVYRYLRSKDVFHRVRTLSVLLGSLSLVLLATISMLIYATLSLRRLSERETQYLSLSVTSVLNNLSYIDKSFAGFVQSDEVQGILTGYMDDTVDERYLRQLALTKLAESQFGIHSAVVDINLFTLYNQPINVYGGPHGDLEVGDIDLLSLFHSTDLYASTGSHLLNAYDYMDPAQGSAANREGVLLLKRIIAKNSTRTIGYLMVYLDKATLFSSLDDEPLSDSIRFVSDAQGQVVFPLDGVDDTVSGTMLPKIQQNELEGKTNFWVQAPDGGIGLSMCAFSSIPGLGWHVVSIIPSAVVAADTMSILLLMLALVLLFSVAFSAMSQAIATSVSIPVNNVLTQLRSIQKENLLPRPHDAHNDELAEVQNLLNETTVRLAQLIEDIRVSEQQKYNLRFQALQAQINPHFLVNTLNSIRWLAELQSADNIKEMTQSLTEILTVCMNSSDAVAPLREELSLLKNYVIISQYRYLDQFEVVFDIDAEAEAYYAPKFILQPLMENCLIHGLDPHTSLLTITVSVRKTGDSITMVLSDNGNGMSDDRLRQVNDPGTDRALPKASTLTSIGIQNIRERLELLYRSHPHSFCISSVIHTGTTITLEIPALHKEDFDEPDLAGR